MFSLVKRDLYVYGWSVLLIFLIIPLGMGVSPEALFLAMVAGFAIHLFYYDNKSKANWYVVSLPVTRRKIIQSRYITLLATAILLLLLQWSISLLAYAAYLKGWHFEVYVYQWQDIVVLVSLYLLISSISIPIYYFFKSFNVAIFVQTAFFFIFIFSFFHLFFNQSDSLYINNRTVFFARLLEANFKFQPYILFPIIAIGFYLISMKVSERLMKRKVI